MTTPDPSPARAGSHPDEPAAQAGQADSVPLPAGPDAGSADALTTRPDANRLGTEHPQSAAAPDPAEAVAVPQDQAGIDILRTEIDQIDTQLVRLIQRRSAVSHAIGTARKSLGGPRIVYSREMAILERFRKLGPGGADLGMILLAMGRGRLGRK